MRRRSLCNLHFYIIRDDFFNRACDNSRAGTRWAGGSSCHRHRHVYYHEDGQKVALFCDLLRHWSLVLARRHL